MVHERGSVKKVLLKVFVTVLILSFVFQPSPALAISNSKISDTETAQDLKLVGDKFSPAPLDPVYRYGLGISYAEMLLDPDLSEEVQAHILERQEPVERPEYIPPTPEQIAQTQSQVESFSCTDVIDVPFIECEALVAFYESTNGTGWDSYNWLSSYYISTWWGITVSEGHVIKIDLQGEGLYGEITPLLGNLSNLINLTIGNNYLTGTIPPELGNLTNLQFIYLGDSQLTGNIPPELGNLSNLKELYLDDLKFSGSIPGELGELSSLEVFYMPNSGLTGNLPTTLGNLSNLQYLDLIGNKFSGSIPQEFGNMVSLRELYLRACGLTGSIPPELGYLSNLVVLSLNQNNLIGSIPPELGNLSNLSVLALHTNQLTGTIPPELGNLTKLETLTLSRNNLTGSIPPDLGSLTNLDLLMLEGTQVTGNIPTEFGNLTNLTQLYLGYNQLSGNIPSSLGNLKELEHLRLSRNGLSGSIPLSFINLTKLYSFDFSDTYLCEPTTPEFLAWKATLEWRWDESGFICGFHTVSGQVFDTNNDAVDAAKVIVSTGDTTLTNVHGNYSLLLPEGTHTFSVLKAGYIFTPNTLTVTLDRDRTGQNFLGEIAYCGNETTGIQAIYCTTPLAVPFLSLPLQTTLTDEQFLRNWNNEGHINSWFDHSMPNYSTSDQKIVTYDGTEHSGTAYKYISGLYGCYDDHCYNGHDALDLIYDDGESVVNKRHIQAAASGVVLEVCRRDVNACSQSTYLGRYVIISHLNNSYATLYAHLSSIESWVEEGEEITVGDNWAPVIGTMGGSGGSPLNEHMYGDHLHFQVFFNKESKNPWTPESDEVVDPFGWINYGIVDPWSTTVPSVWLWKDFAPTYIFPDELQGVLELGSVSVEIPEGSEYQGQLVSLLPSSLYNRTVFFLRSIGNAFSVSVNDLFNTNSQTDLNGSSLFPNYSTPVRVSIDYSEINPHLDSSQLSLYQFDKVFNQWNNVPTILDPLNFVASAEVLPNGSFDVQAPLVCEIDLSEPYDDRLSSMNLLSVNQSDLLLTRLFDIEVDEDWIGFEALPGVTYTFQTQNLAAGVDTVLSLYAADGITQIDTDDNSGGGLSSRLVFTPDEQGLFYVKVSQGIGSSFGCESGYDLRFTNNIKLIFLPLVER